jgi:hypothetical protein
MMEDDDGYVTMSNDYKINSNSTNENSIFYNYNQMNDDMVISKASDISLNDMSGNPKDIKHIRSLQQAGELGHKQETGNNNNVCGISPPSKDRSQREDRRSQREDRSERDDQRRQRDDRLSQQGGYLRNTTPQYSPRLSNNNKVCSSDGSCSLRSVKQIIDYTICPICGSKWEQTCSCRNHDSICRSGHKWHTMNGRIKLGHSH